MPATLFEARVREAGDAVALDLCGDVDGHAEEPLEAAFETAAALEPARLILNFTEVGYINSTGIAVIVGLLARARARGLRVRAFGLSPHYREIFAITRLSDFMALYDDEAAAVAGGA